MCQAAAGHGATAHVVMIAGGPITRVEAMKMPQIIDEVKADLIHVGVTEPRIEVRSFDDVLQFEAAVPAYLLKLHGRSGS